MEHPDTMSSDQMSALLAESRALSADGLEEMRAQTDRTVVQIKALPSSPDDPNRQEFRIVTTRGEPGDRHYHQSYHGCIALLVIDDGYSDVVLVTFSVSSPLR